MLLIAGTAPLLAALPAPAPEAETGSQAEAPALRFASFNIWELSAEKLDRVDGEGRGVDVQLLKAAEIIQRVRPDVLLLNEIDFHAERNLARTFIERYLAHGQNGQLPIDFPRVVYLPTNTGVQSGFDLDNDGELGSPEDGWGFGRYPGQYGMALLSKLEVDRDSIRTFRELLWRSMPGHLLPDGRSGRPAWYSSEEAAALRLSSKSHWDVPIRIGDRTVHVLASHPTPPIFDSDEDRNGRRNHDEIRFWVDYLSADSPSAPASHWLVDDQGRHGGLPAGTPFVLMGDLNADPWKTEALYGKPAIVRLVEHPRIRDPVPLGPGELENQREYPGPPRARTCNYGRIDYALPSRNLEVVDSGVFLPAKDDPARALVEGEDRASDHFLVWVDIRPPS